MNDAAAYPIELDTEVTLPNARHVRIRPLRPCEIDPIRELDARLSPATRYLRFFSPMPRVSDPLLRLLACVDYRRRLAVIVEAIEDGEDAGDSGDAGDARLKPSRSSRSSCSSCSSRSVVALGNYAAVDDETAEVAVVVQDDWQRQGVGTAVVAQLLCAAERRGFHRFVVHMEANNAAIRKLLHRFGRVVTSRTSLGVSEVSFVPLVPGVRR